MTAAKQYPDGFVQGLRDTVAGGRQVRRRLPGWGLVHIDRPQPFLCVYRRPPVRADDGAERLLNGLASYLVAEGRRQTWQSLRTLVDGLVGELTKAFGAAVLLEVWSGERVQADIAEGQPDVAHFRIVVPATGADNETLDALEMALLTADWGNHPVEIAMDFKRQCRPPELPALLTATRARDLNCLLLGLEVPPLFRDPETGKPFPGVLRHMTASLGKALSQAFYAFAHARARYRPAHYHELGRKAMTSAVREVDRTLARVGDNFDLLLHVTPVNAEAAWHALRRSRFGRPPEFHYRPLIFDPGALKRLLYRAPLDTVEDPALHQLFSAKRDELDRQITMLADRGTEKFLFGSQQIYGRPGAGLRQVAKEILENLPPHGRDDRITDVVDAAVFARLAERELAHYRRSDPDLVSRVEVRKDVPGVLVSRGRLLIGHTTKVAKARVEATLHHEVGTHIVTYYNGLKQPFQQFHAGMPGYEEMQEGLAVLAEFLVGGLSRPRLRLLAARVLAVDSVIDGADFIDTFGVLHDDWGFSQRVAYTIAMRVHRGGGFTKDAVYLRGLMKVIDYLAAGGILDNLYVGKVAFEHIDLVEELGWRQVVKPGTLRPRYLDDVGGRKRLARIRSGGHILDLVKEAA